MAAGFAAALLVLLGVVGPMVPPKFSKSLSFNAKTQWLKEVERCDVLVLGSSMALNNIDGRELRGLAPDGSVVNVGSWALRMDELLALYGGLSEKCRPKIVVIPVYYGDFSRPPGKKVISKDIRWDWVDRYLKGDGESLAARVQTDLNYVLESWSKLHSTEYRSNSYYTSLDFDATGGVVLGQRFHIDPKRWTGYLSQSGERVDAVEYEHFGELLRRIQADGGKAIVVRTPMTAEATARFDTQVTGEHWRHVEAVAARARGRYVDLSSMSLPDENFADFCHLRGSGATLFTRRLVSESGILADNGAGSQSAARGRATK
jgi:hypothetical protein